MTGFFTLLRREVYRFIILPNQTLIREISGVPYILYIFPGLVMMGVVNGAYMNTCSSLFIARNEFFIQDLLVSPISYWEMVLAYNVGGALRGFLVGLLTLLTGFTFLGVHVHNPAALLFFLFISAVTAAAFGIIIGLWADQWDHVAIHLNYVITPLVFLGGVFYSMEMLPSWWAYANLFNPIFYIVNGLRYATLGVTDISPLACGAVALALSGTLFSVAVELFRKGWKLRI